MKNSILGKARWLREVALATSKNNGARVAQEWLKYAAMFVMLLTLGSGNVWGAKETVTISTIASANSWTNGTHYSGWTSSSGKFTFTAANSGQGLYYTSDNSWRGYKSKGSMVITAGSGITISSVTSSASASWSVASGGGSASFTPTATIKFTSFTITYTEAASCDNKVTLTKAATSSGSFTLHSGSASGSEISSGGKVDNCDNDAVVVVKPSANTNYHVASVEATNKKSLSGPDASGNYTITYTKGGNVSSTITVTFEADPTYTVTWVAGSNSSFHTQTDYAGTALTAPGTPDASTYCPGGKVFVGWTATPIAGETNTVPADLFTSVSGMSIPAEDKTYYAVFATATPANNYKQITSEGALEAGKKYLIVGNSSTTYEALPVDAATSLTAVTPSSSTITTTTAAIIWTLEGSADAWKIKSTSNSKYLQISGGNLTFETSTTLTFSVGVSSSKFTFTSSASSGNKVLSYYNAQNKFNAYSSANTVYVYKQQVNYTAYATTCSADPMLNVDPTTLNFGNVANGTYKEMKFSLSGTNLAENASIAVSGTNSSYFTVSPSSVNKGSGTISATDITVRYTPGAVGDGHTATVTVTSGEAEAKTVTLTGNSKATYSVSVSPTPSNGTVIADKTSGIMEGETVTLTITPSSGYQLSSISAVDGSSNPVSLTGTGNSRTFTMPASNVTIAATFEALTYYTLVTDVSELSDGDLITIGSGIGNSTTIKILHTQESNNRNTKEVTTTAEGKILETDISYPIRLDNDANGWKLYDTQNSGYLYATKGQNYLKNSASPTYNDVWKIAIVQTSGSSQYQAQIHLEPCNSNGCGQETRNNKTYDRYIEFNGETLSAYLFNMDDGYIYKKELSCERLAAPTGLSAGALTQTTATLSWTAVANASGYEISLDNGSNWTSAGTNTSYSATSLTQGTAYNWKVRATGDGSTYCAKGSAASSSFTTKRAVKVTYTTNGATGGTLPVSGGVVNNLTEGDSHTILDNVNNLTKTGYTWAGWHNSTTYSATPAYTVGETITVTGDITLYANWMPKRDTYIDGVHGTAEQYGDGADYTIPSCSDQSSATTGACDVTHYKFIGWALIGADLTNPANIISAGGTKTATGATYYAVWGEEL